MKNKHTGSSLEQFLKEENALIGFQEKRDKYLEENFKVDSTDGMVRKIRSGSFKGNGLLTTISWDDLEDIADWAKKELQKEKT